MTLAGSPAAGRGRRVAQVGALALGLAALGALAVAHARIDADEGQHLHAAWLVGQGRTPYLDFWEHHMPVLAYGLAPLTRWFADRPEVYFAGRAVIALTGAATLALIYVLGRRLGPHVGIAAVVLVALQMQFLLHSVEVRPDGPALAAWLVCVWMLVLWRERATSRWLFAAGLALGATAALTPKAVFVGAGTVVLLLASPPVTVGRIVRNLGWLAAGCAIPLAGVLGLLAASGGVRALQQFVKHVVVTNLGFPDFTIEPPLELEGIGFSILAAAGIAMTIDRQGWRTLQHPVHGPLMIPPAIASAILLLPTTPAVYSYTWLPVVASLSVYAGLALVAAFHRLRSGLTVANGVIALLVASATIVPAWVIGVRLVPRNLANDADLARMRRELAYACPGEAVLDGGPLVVFRPGALRYPSLVEGVRTWIIRGIIPAEPLLEDLRRAQAPVGLFDYRIQDLKGAIGAFIASHYVPEPDKLLVAGRSLTLSAEAGEVEVELLKSGRYRLSASAGVRATIDGVAPPAAVATPGAGAQAPVASVWLDAGAHRFSWIGGPGTLRIVIAPCAERRSRGADAA